MASGPTRLDGTLMESMPPTITQHSAAASNPSKSRLAPGSVYEPMASTTIRAAQSTITKRASWRMVTPP
jgi:hypothetical protein